MHTRIGGVDRRYLNRLAALAERGRAARARITGERTAPRAARLLPIRNAPTTGRTVVRLYGAIGQSYWDEEAVSAGDLARTLDTIGPNGIDLHISSGGGNVFDGIAMHAALLNHPSDVTSYVDGLAASAASFVAMAGDEIVIEKPAKMMVHNASGLVLGEASAMREMADLLDEISTTIAGVYADRTGRPVAEWVAAMGAETWYSAAQAVEAGLADRVNNGEPAARQSPAPAARASAADRSAAIRANHARLVAANRRWQLPGGGWWSYT